MSFPADVVDMVRQWADFTAANVGPERDDLDSMSIGFKSSQGVVRLIHTQQGAQILLPSEKPVPVAEWLAAQEAGACS